MEMLSNGKGNLMERYQVLLSSELSEAYQTMADQLGMSVEQILSAAVHIYAEWLNQKTYEEICDLSRLRRIPLAMPPKE